MWLQDIESFETVTSDPDTRRLILRMAQLSREGRLEAMVQGLEEDGADEETAEAFSDLAEDPTFLLAVEEYLGRTRIRH